MCLLHRHAYAGCTGRRGDRATALWPFRLARHAVFQPRERAALAWTEAITNIQQGHASDEAYKEVRREFSEKELVRLTMAIAQINTWNRISIAFKVEPGHYLRISRSKPDEA